MCNHYRKDQKVIEWAVRRGETGAAGEEDLSRSAKSPASRRRGAPVERDLRARFFGVAQAFHPGNAPGGRVPPAGAPRRSTRKPEPGYTAFCTAPIAGRLQVLPQKKRTVCGDAVHAERGEFSRERNFVDGPHADLQPGILHPRDELLIHRESAIQIETVEVCRLRLHNERVGRGRTRDRRIVVIGPP